MISQALRKGGTYLQETVYKLTAKGLKGTMCLAVSSDIHDRPYQDILASLKRHQPDMILMPGDFISGYTPETERLKMQDSPSLNMISAFASLAPTYISLGNHEWMLSGEDIALIESTGARVLDNNYVTVNGLVLGGLTSGTVIRCRRYYRKKKNRYPKKLPYRNVSYFDQFKRGSFEKESYMQPKTGWIKKYLNEPGWHILLSHHPEYWSYPPICLRDLPIELVLSGHAHGGQIRYYSLIRHEWRGLFAPFQGLFPEYTGGQHSGEHGSMIISRGLSNTGGLIPRLFNPREMVYITLEGTDG